MPSVAEIRAAGTELLLVPKPIYEPLNAPLPFSDYLTRFTDNYDLSPSSHLMRFLFALCGDSGAGALKRELLYPKLQSALDSTHFDDLDQLYGDPLALPRFSEELYSIDPKNIAMTQAQWQEVITKDAAYRARCLIWMRALIEGPTPYGISLAATAAVGVECDVFERYAYLENQASDIPVAIPNYGNTNSRQEFVIVPRTASISDRDLRRLGHLVDRLRPQNTIFSVVINNDVRFTRTIHNVSSTSDNFNVDRYVTGRPDIVWPDPDPSLGLWIQAGIENEAPQFAWFQRQESATYLSIAGVTATSEHIGTFNPTQRQLFGNLQDPDPLRQYSARCSYAPAFAPITTSKPWVGGNPITVVNGYYPLDYFGNVDISQVTNIDPTMFWASNEEFAPAAEQLVFDLGTVRPMNELDFEICKKPIDIEIEWSVDGVTWANVSFDPNYAEQTSISYIPSIDSPWQYTEHHFDLIQTRYFRITFTRRDETFPFDTSDDFEWSIEVRNLHATHLIFSAEDFIADTGVDILGNTYRTDLSTFPSTNLTDGDPTTFWQSQPNPVPDSVEALYFDLRTTSTTGTMDFLDVAAFMDEYDSRGMSDMELYYSNAVIVDEIYLDPVTVGAYMHVYYSNDDDPDWDNKLWSPILRHYIVTKGYHTLPTPVTAKYFKLEFTNLTPAPYQALEYPTAPLLQYRKFPTWVQDYFSSILNTKIISAGSFANPFDRVTIDPLVFGFQHPPDRFDSGYPVVRTINPEESLNEIQTFINNLTSVDPILQAKQESKIEFNPSFMWQDNLTGLLDAGRALSRFVQTTETNITAELTPFVTPVPDTQSVPDLSQEEQRKIMPPMFFNRACRHQYQLMQAPRPSKVAYFVALKNVAFTRRDYSAQYDESYYYLSPNDTAQTSNNDFTQSDWRWEVSP